MALDIRSRIGISSYFFCYHAAMGLIFAFVPIFLKDLGFSYTQLGQLAFASALTGAVVQLGIGYLSDHLRMRRPPVVLAMLSLAIVYQLFRYFSDYAPFVALYAIAGIGTWSSQTLVTALVGDLSDGESRSYLFASMRVFGSMGWVIALIATLIWRPLLQNPMLFFGAISLFFALAGVSVLLAREAPAHQTPTMRPPLRESAKALVGSSNMLVFLFAYLIFMVSLSSLNNFLPLFIQRELGVAPDSAKRFVSMALITSATCEVPFMLWLSRVSDRVGRRPLLLLAFGMLPIRLFILSHMTVPGWAVATQVFHGVTWGVMMTVSVAFVAESVPAHLRASGQGLLTMVTAAASGLWAVAAGRIGDQFGLGRMLLVVGIIASGSFLLGLFLKEPALVAAAKDKEAISIAEE